MAGHDQAWPGHRRLSCRRHLSLNPGKTAICATAEPTTSLGYVLSPRGRRLPEENVRRFRNRWRGLHDRVALAASARTRRCSVFHHGSPMPSTPTLGASATPCFAASRSTPPAVPPSAVALIAPSEGWPVTSRLCVVRGGSWNNNWRNCRSAYRNSNHTAGQQCPVPGGPIPGCRDCSARTVLAMADSVRKVLQIWLSAIL